MLGVGEDERELGVVDMLFVYLVIRGDRGRFEVPEVGTVAK